MSLLRCRHGTSSHNNEMIFSLNKIGTSANMVEIHLRQEINSIVKARQAAGKNKYAAWQFL